MFGRKTEVLDISPVFIKEVAVPARDQVDDITGIGSECSECFSSSFGGNSLGRNFNNRGEGSLEYQHRVTTKWTT